MEPSEKHLVKAPRRPFEPGVLAILGLGTFLAKRYFFVADIVSIIYAFYTLKRFFVPVVVSGASLLSYFPFLFREEPIGLQYLAVLMGVALLVAAADLIWSLYPNLIEQSR